VAIGQTADGERCSVRDVVLRKIPCTAIGVPNIQDISGINANKRICEWLAGQY
jgi:hypothetical protein